MNTVRHHLAIALVLLMVGSASAESETVTINFSNKGKPTYVSGDGDLDDMKPLTKGDILFNLAPGDVVNFDVIGPRTFDGKTMHAKADTVDVQRSEETVAIFFSREVVTRTPIAESQRWGPWKVTIGSTLKVWLMVKYFDGSAIQRVDLPALGPEGWRMPKGGEVWIELEFNKANVAFEKRKLDPPERNGPVERWLNDLRAIPYREVVNYVDGYVLPGNLGQMQVKLTVTR